MPGAASWLLREHGPHDLDREVVEFRQLLFTEAVDMGAMDDLLFGVLGKPDQNMGVVMCEMIVFRS